MAYLAFSSAMSDQPRSDFGEGCDADAAALVQTGFERIPKIWGMPTSLEPFETPSPFLCRCTAAGAPRQGRPSSAPSRLCLLQVERNGEVSLGSSRAIRGPC